MPQLIKNILALFVGIIIGGLVNMGLVTIGPMIIAPPPGVDMTDVESLGQTMELLRPQHFLFPFLAHALGTLVGATLAFILAGRNPQLMAYGIGVFFLAGGIMMVRMIAAPLWFSIVDLTLAYLPMAWLAIVIGTRFKTRIKTGG